MTPEEDIELKDLRGFVEVLGVSEMTEEQFNRYIALLDKKIGEYDAKAGK